MACSMRGRRYYLGLMYRLVGVMSLEHVEEEPTLLIIVRQMIVDHRDVDSRYEEIIQLAVG